MRGPREVVLERAEGLALEAFRATLLALSEKQADETKGQDETQENSEDENLHCGNKGN
jgi:hypothetical protein